MRFRLIEPRDFAICRSLLNPALHLSSRVLAQLPIIWQTLMVFGTLSVVEDPSRPHPDSVQGFGASVFVGEEFVDEFIEARRNYLDAALYERILDGRSPVLSEEQIARANAGDGLSLVVFNYGLRRHDLTDPIMQRVVQAGTAAFYSLHAGYRLKTILNEVFGADAAQYLSAGGFRRQDTVPEAHAITPSETPQLFILRRAWVQPGVIDTLSSLFHPPRPQ